MYTPKIENGDLVLDQSGHTTNLTGKDAAKQIVMNALAMWKGTWFLKPNDGIDWMEVTKKGKTINEILQIITSGLVKNPYIQKVIDTSISFKDDTDIRNRKATLNYIVLIDNQNIVGSVSLI